MFFIMFFGLEEQLLFVVRVYVFNWMGWEGVLVELVNEVFFWKSFDYWIDYEIVYVNCNVDWLDMCLKIVWCFVINFLNDFGVVIFFGVNFVKCVEEIMIWLEENFEVV